MLRELYVDGPSVSRGLDSFGDVVHRVLDVRSDADLGALARGALQNYIGHDVMVAAWGDFHIGLVHYDLYCVDSTIQAENVEAGPFYPVLDQLFQSWISCGRIPLVLNAQGLKDAWALCPPRADAVVVLSTMQSVMVHGIQDQRGRHDSLYAFFSAAPKSHRDETYAVKILVPYIDFALRQVVIPLPRRESHGAPGKDGRGAIGEARQERLTEREVEIMEWVALGKTNSEIGGILNLSSFTIKNHMQRIFKKLDVFNRIQAVAVFRSRHGTSA